MQHVVYELEVDDMVAFGNHHAAHAPYIVNRVQRLRWIYGALFAVLAFNAYESASALAIGTAAFGFAFVLFYPFWVQSRYRKQNQTLFRSYDPAYFGRHELALQNHQLRLKSKAAESAMKVSMLDRIEETPDYVFIYAGPNQAVVVPKKRITSGDVQSLKAELSRSIPMRSFL